MERTERMETMEVERTVTQKDELRGETLLK
jgi:hypothetical protein